MFFCEFGEIFKNTFFKEHFQVTASDFMLVKAWGTPTTKITLAR